MRFADIDNIWTVDLTSLSNVERGRVYFERAKQVVGEALADPVKRDRAVKGERFRRAYLVEQIGCQPAVTTQNPKVRRLLADTDRQLARLRTEEATIGRQASEGRSTDATELRAMVETLRQRVEVQAAEIVSLRCELRRERARA